MERGTPPVTTGLQWREAEPASHWPAPSHGAPRLAGRRAASPSGFRAYGFRAPVRERRGAATDRPTGAGVTSRAAGGDAVFPRFWWRERSAAGRAMPPKPPRRPGAARSQRCSPDGGSGSAPPPRSPR